MNRLIPYLLVGVFVLGLFVLSWLLDAVKDRVTVVVAALILYILCNEWRVATL
jgi:fucose permease